jgi:hypothetical protein
MFADHCVAPGTGPASASNDTVKLLSRSGQQPSLRLKSSIFANWNVPPKSTRK